MTDDTTPAIDPAPEPYDFLEPASFDPNDRFGYPSGEQICLSAAISAKRQADALERIANSLEGIGAGWGNVSPLHTWDGKCWPRQAPAPLTGDA